MGLTVAVHLHETNSWTLITLTPLATPLASSAQGFCTLAEPCSIVQCEDHFYMNSLALDYFALEDESAWAPQPGHPGHPDVRVEDFPVGQVKWHWDAPPLTAALMQVYCPMAPHSALESLTESLALTELAAELDCFCCKASAVQFPKVVPRPRQKLLDDDGWTGHSGWTDAVGWSSTLSNEELLNLSRQWLSEYAAEKVQDMSPDEADAIKQVDQECEWMNQFAESHDFLKDVEMQKSSPDTGVEAKTKMLAEKTNAKVGQESIAQSVPKISSPLRAVLPVQSHHMDVTEASVMSQGCPDLPSQAQVLAHAESPDRPNPPAAAQAETALSKVWRPAETATRAENAGKRPLVRSVQSLDLKELGVDSLPSIWTLENLPGEQQLHLPSVCEPGKFVVDGHLKLLGT